MVCDDCGEDKEDVMDTFCPYAWEILEEDVPVSLCESCYHERCMEI
jgi:hypothetical protein